MQPRTTRTYGALALIVAAQLVTLNCATLKTPPGDQTVDQQQTRLVEMNKIADLTEKATDLIAAVQETEIQVYDAKLVASLTPEKHAQIQEGFKKFADEARAEVAIAQDLSKTDADRRKAVAAFTQRAREFLGGLQIDSPVVKAGIQAALSTIELLNLAS